MLSLMILWSAFGSSKSVRTLYDLDVSRTKLNQNVRSSLDFIGLYVRQAGERLPQGVPAIEIVDGVDGAPDQLIVRRNLLDEVLTVCNDISAGSTDTISLTESGGSPACTYGGQTQAYQAWRDNRLAEGGSLTAYIFNLATKEGEFFEYTGEVDTGLTMQMYRDAAPFSHDYSANSSGVYLLLEWRFALGQSSGNQGVLEITENGEVAASKRVVFGLTNFQVEAVLTDGTVLTSFSSSDNWADLRSVQIRSTAQEESRGRTLETTLEAAYFPRNILSL